MDSLNDLKYSDNSIGKKQIYCSESGMVVELAFDEGKGLDTHTAPGDVMVQIIEGEVLFNVEGTDCRMRTSDYILLKAGQEHSVKAIGKAKILVTKFPMAR